MLLSELYLISTTDKTPFVFEPDSIFDSIGLNNSNEQIIDSLVLNSAVYRFGLPCSRLEFNHSYDQGRELYQPFGGSLAHYSYTLSILNEYGSITISDFWDTFGSLASNNYQCIFKTTDGTWYICYAELEAESFNNNYADKLIITLRANDVKEGLYEIESFSTNSLTVDYDFTIGAIT
jgi:hypothetical protein